MRKLKAGALSLGYDNGFIRRISYGGTEVLRMIYFALRDHNWNTIAGEIYNEQIEANDDSFLVTYSRREIVGGVTVMIWDAEISGFPDGTVAFRIRGKMETDFKRNRAGFCVLHPLAVAGTECVIFHGDGSQSKNTFPTHIAPEDPFLNVRAMEWKGAGRPFRVEFDGDLFETEDQRNWGDASFKTFCTPLSKPFPVLLNRGETIEQHVTFRPPALDVLSEPTGRVSLREADLHRVVPALGVAASTEREPMPSEVAAQLKECRFNHYRVEVTPSHETWVRDFSNACEEAVRLRIPLEVALHLSDREDEEIEAFLLLCQQNEIRPARVLVLALNALVTQPGALDGIERLKNGLRNARVGAGTDYNFTEINRNRFDGGRADFISYSFSPQEHASDDITLLENTATPEDMVKSTQAIFGLPVHVSPVVLKRRFNPYANDPSDWVLSREEQLDARLGKGFAAQWTFAALCSLIRGGASAITLFQSWGDLGIVAANGTPKPVFDTLKQFAAFQGKPARILDSSDPLAVQAVVLDNRVFGVVNLSDEEKIVEWEGKEIKLTPQSQHFEVLERPQQA